jgi:hypothetical protein
MAAACVPALAALPGAPLARAKDEIAAPEIAEATNWRRVMSFNMEGFLPGYATVRANMARAGLILA